MNQELQMNCAQSNVPYSYWGYRNNLNLRDQSSTGNSTGIIFKKDEYGRIKDDPTIENYRCLIAVTYRPYAGVQDLVAVHYFAGLHPDHPSAFAITFTLSASPIITIT